MADCYNVTTNNSNSAAAATSNGGSDVRSSSRASSSRASSSRASSRGVNKISNSKHDIREVSFSVLSSSRLEGKEDCTNNDNDNANENDNDNDNDNIAKDMSHEDLEMDFEGADEGDDESCKIKPYRERIETLSTDGSDIIIVTRVPFSSSSLSSSLTRAAHASGSSSHHRCGQAQESSRADTCLNATAAYVKMWVDYWCTGQDWWSVWLGLMWLPIISICATNSVLLPEMIDWKKNAFDAFLNDHLWYLFPQLLLIFASTLFALYIMQEASSRAQILDYLKGFTILLILAFLSKWIGRQIDLKNVGIGAAVWAIILGAAVSNIYGVIGVPMPTYITCLAKSSCSIDEFFIKVSVVLLGLNFPAVIAIGAKGLAVAWIDTPLLIVAITHIGTKYLDLPMKTSLIMACAVSVCGTSAAAAVVAALGATNSDMMPSVAVMSIFTTPAIPLLPLLAIKGLKLSQYVVGAWVGGCVDTTGGVIASAAIAGDEALKTAAVVKMLQNASIAPISVAVSIWYHRKMAEEEAEAAKLVDESQVNDPLLPASSLSSSSSSPVVVTTKKPHPTLIQYIQLMNSRFPKFVLGFLLVSLLISFSFPGNIREDSFKWSFYLSEWYATLGFVAIGLNSQFAELLKKTGGSKQLRALVFLYIIGQTMDIISTGLVAYGMFQ